MGILTTLQERCCSRIDGETIGFTHSGTSFATHVSLCFSSFREMDQLLGRETGRVFNDEALAVAAGIRSPEQATQTIENSLSKNRI
jgi:hypothetical protein